MTGTSEMLITCDVSRGQMKVSCSSCTVGWWYRHKHSLRLQRFVKPTLFPFSFFFLPVTILHIWNYANQTWIKSKRCPFFYALLVDKHTCILNVATLQVLYNRYPRQRCSAKRCTILTHFYGRDLGFVGLWTLARSTLFRTVIKSILQPCNIQTNGYLRAGKK